MIITDEQTKELLKYDTDDDGHCEAFIVVWLDKYRFSKEAGWMVHNGRHWSRKAGDASIECDIKLMLRLRRATFAEKLKEVLIDDDKEKGGRWLSAIKACRGKTTLVKSIKSMLQSHPRIYCDIDKFDNDKNTINANNGVVNLKDGSIEPHNPKQLFTYCLNVDYKLDAPPPAIWLAFLESTEIGQPIIDYLQLAIGYTLTGHTNEECLFFLHGVPRSGKSTILDIILTIMGDLASGANMQSFTGKRYGDTNNFDLAPFRNKRLLVATETGIGDSLNAATIKALTGGDPVYASFKGRDHFTYLPMYKIWIASNIAPNSNADDDAYWSRQRIIDFLKSFLGAEDKTLKRRLKSKDSLERIFKWMVDGSVAWYKLEGEGLPIPERVQIATNTHRRVADSVKQFIEDCCKYDTEKYTVGAVLYNSYKSWCEDEGYKPYGRRRFTNTLKNGGIISKTVRTDAGKTAKAYIGIVES